jgi:hypothetical protein
VYNVQTTTSSVARLALQASLYWPQVPDVSVNVDLDGLNLPEGGAHGAELPNECQ